MLLYPLAALQFLCVLHRVEKSVNLVSFKKKFHQTVFHKFPFRNIVLHLTVLYARKIFAPVAAFCSVFLDVKTIFCFTSLAETLYPSLFLSVKINWRIIHVCKEVAFNAEALEFGYGYIAIRYSARVKM